MAIPLPDEILVGIWQKKIQEIQILCCSNHNFESRNEFSALKIHKEPIFYEFKHYYLDFWEFLQKFY